mmetsp:Transcript_51520/g.112933  ORF Transcript_51520/g.112933 Transcript_51520/m.112933 type:complete len:296 (+) Transcript_51520:1001-1888(+)
MRCVAKRSWGGARRTCLPPFQSRRLLTASKASTHLKPRTCLASRRLLHWRARSVRASMGKDSPATSMANTSRRSTHESNGPSFSPDLPRPKLPPTACKSCTRSNSVRMASTAVRPSLVLLVPFRPCGAAASKRAGAAAMAVTAAGAASSTPTLAKSCRARRNFSVSCERMPFSSAVLETSRAKQRLRKKGAAMPFSAKGRKSSVASAKTSAVLPSGPGAALSIAGARAKDGKSRAAPALLATRRNNACATEAEKSPFPAASKCAANEARRGSRTCLPMPTHAFSSFEYNWTTSNR